MDISGKELLHFHQEISSLIGYQTNHRTNSCYESDYECFCIVVNGEKRSVPLNILSSVHVSSLPSQGDVLLSSHLKIKTYLVKYHRPDVYLLGFT